MRKILLTILFSLPVFSFSAVALAQPDIGRNGLMKDVGQTAQYNVSVNDYTLADTIGRVIRSLLTFVGTIFFVLAVYAGFLWMTAQGNEQQVAKAQGIFKTAIIGMIVVVASYSITYFVMVYVSASNMPDTTSV